MNWFRISLNWCLTGSPQHLALGVHAGTDASVAEGGFVLAGFSVLQEDVGRAVRGGAGAELREVALSERLATHGARRTQLRGEELNLIRLCVCVCVCMCVCVCVCVCMCVCVRVCVHVCVSL